MKKNKPADAVLVRKYVSGDETALNELILRYRHKLYGYILSRVRHPDVAEDIFQDTFIKIIHTLKSGKYNEEGKFGSWLMRIAHNLIIDHFRRQKRSQLRYDTDDFSMFDVLSDNILAETQIIRNQTVEKVKKLIEQLPEEQKTVLKMRIYDEIPFKEIAELQNISINTALGRMRYALINIRKMIEKENPF
jgi:RNA polymerase sigma-70 factor (ECF subfamily)